MTPYSPELNPVEHVCDKLREMVFGSMVFNNLDALEDHMEVSLKVTKFDTPRVHSIAGWLWIMKALLK